MFVGCRVSEVYWSSLYRIGARVASTLRRQRLLLVGDAAHIHPPVLGQGMNLGMQVSNPLYHICWALGCAFLVFFYSFTVLWFLSLGCFVRLLPLSFLCSSPLPLA